MNKELKDMTINEFIDFVTWTVIQGIIKGESIRSLISHVVFLTLEHRTPKK